MTVRFCDCCNIVILADPAYVVRDVRCCRVIERAVEAMRDLNARNEAGTKAKASSSTSSASSSPASNTPPPKSWEQPRKQQQERQKQRRGKKRPEAASIGRTFDSPSKLPKRSRLPAAAVKEMRSVLFFARGSVPADQKPDSDGKLSW